MIAALTDAGCRIYALGKRQNKKITLLRHDLNGSSHHPYDDLRNFRLRRE